MKAELAKELSRVEDFEDPRVSLEQYLTPPQLAADIIHMAFMQGDIEGRKVLDSGTGTGILAIGAALTGGKVTAVEKDPEALELARKNARELGVREMIEFVETDIEDFNGEFDTAVMNPPFSVHSDSGGGFFRKAFALAGKVYSVAPGSKERIKGLAENSGHALVSAQPYSIELPPTYGFHTEEGRETRVNVIVTEEKDDGT